MGMRLHDERLADGLRLRASDDAGSAVLARFYEGYDRAFVLADEREGLAGFRACLALNRTLPVAFGRRHSEQVLVLEAADGTLLGGANFLAIAMTAPGGPAVSLALNYVYVERAARGRGLARVLIAQAGRMANLALAGDPAAPGPAMFIEQNDPLALSGADYAADTLHAGIDQIDRLAVWARMGARLVDFPYVQPALSPGQAPDDGLIYAALAYPGDAVPPRWFHDHLQSFFGVSVRKGAPLGDDAVASAQLEALGTRIAPLALLPVDRAIALLKADRRCGAGARFRQFVAGIAT